MLETYEVQKNERFIKDIACAIHDIEQSVILREFTTAIKRSRNIN